MARIPQHFIDELLARTDIVDLIDGRVPLKKKGREYAACCPFHSEKTPSFYVAPDKQFYHCFGCGAHGTALSFLMEYDNMDFRDAVRELADQAGLEVPEDDSGPAPDPDGALREALNHADQWFRTRLRATPEAKDYLQGRGLSGRVAADFGLGYAPDGWSGLLDSARDDQQREALLATGMLIRNDSGRLYDRFRGRVMFPIRDSRGRTIAFGGRIMGDGEPKYLNSPEHPLFHKGRELYGLYEARQALRDIPRLLVVEGYMDVIGLAEAGIHWAVATLGTSATPDHLNKAFRNANEVICCFDGDSAGRRAAWRALENALPVLRTGREVRFLFLPEGEDPDSMVQQEGRDAFEERVKQATSLSRWLRERLSDGLDLSGAEGKAALVARARPLLDKVRDEVYRSLLADELADAAGLAPERWAAMLARGGETQRERPAAAGGQPGRPTRQATGMRLTPIREAIALILQHPGLAADAGDTSALKALDIKGIETLCELLNQARENGSLSTAALLERWRDRPEHPHMERLAAHPIPGEEDNLRLHLQEIIRRLTGPRAVEARLNALLQKEAESGMTAEEKQEFRQLLQRRNDTENGNGSGNLRA
jgi:DNA primase